MVDRMLPMKAIRRQLNLFVKGPATQPMDRNKIYIIICLIFMFRTLFILDFHALQ